MGEAIVEPRNRLEICSSRKVKIVCPCDAPVELCFVDSTGATNLVSNLRIEMRLFRWNGWRSKSMRSRRRKEKPITLCSPSCHMQEEVLVHGQYECSNNVSQADSRNDSEICVLLSHFLRKQETAPNGRYGESSENTTKTPGTPGDGATLMTLGMTRAWVLHI